MFGLYGVSIEARKCGKPFSLRLMLYSFVRLSALSLNENKFETMSKRDLIDFMIWYKNNVPIGTQKTSEQIVDSYLESIKSQPQNESPNIRQNEEQVRNCWNCKHQALGGDFCICPDNCVVGECWEAIPIVPTEGHSA